MKKYLIQVTFSIEVEENNAEEAENIGWDWTPKHPQDDGYGSFYFVCADKVDVIEELGLWKGK